MFTKLDIFIYESHYCGLLERMQLPSGSFQLPVLNIKGQENFKGGNLKVETQVFQSLSIGKTEGQLEDESDSCG